MKRLKEQMVRLKRSVDINLEIAEFLKGKTIESVLGMDDGELGIDFMIGKGRI